MIKIKSKFMIILSIAALASFIYSIQDVAAKEDFTMELVTPRELTLANNKVAYLTFDDGPSVYTEKLLDVLNEYGVPGIFFVLGNQFENVDNPDDILNRILNEGHFIALHSMTHDKNALYFCGDSPSRFVAEMRELKSEIQNRTGHVTNLCRAPYGKANHFKKAHHALVGDAGLYCIDWHVDSKDWAKNCADAVYRQVLREMEGAVYNGETKQMEKVKDKSEIVLLFHEYQHTVDVMPRVIEYLISEGFTFEPYIEGKHFEGLK